MNLYIGYSSTVKIMAGLIVFPLFLWGAYRIGDYFLLNDWLALLAITLLFALGYWVEQYQDAFRRVRARQNALRAEPATLKSLYRRTALSGRCFQGVATRLIHQNQGDFNHV